jgi:hypothetical protein
VVAVLATHWETRSEAGWMTRQVAGAIAQAAEVHVVTPGGTRAGASTDSVFTLHHLATPVDPLVERRRDLVVEAVSASLPSDALEIPGPLAGWIDRALVEAWRDAGPVLAGLGPDLVVVAGHDNVGAVAALESLGPDLSMVLLALADDGPGPGFPHFDPVIERAGPVLAVTEAERRALLARHPYREVHRIGAPMAANPSVLSEPNTWVGPTEYIVVLTGVGLAADHEETELARLIRLRFPENPVGIVHTDAFDAWHRGRLNRGWAVERSSDLARLMAWARVTVDLRPGRLFARRCVESLLFGTPIVVPEGSRAREHAERGRGGLWFAHPAELTWCIEALLDGPTNAAFGGQGRTYAEAEYGSTTRFVERVLGACGLADPATGTSGASGVAGVEPVGLTA